MPRRGCRNVNDRLGEPGMNTIPKTAFLCAAALLVLAGVSVAGRR